MDNNIIKQTIEYNNKFNNRLITTKKLVKDDIDHFDGAYIGGDASSIQWLVNKLKIIKKVIDDGNSFQIENFGEIDTTDEFLEWIINKYSQFIAKEVYRRSATTCFPTSGVLPLVSQQVGNSEAFPNAVKKEKIIEKNKRDV